MPRISDTQLMKDIKSGTIENLYFFYGVETWLLERSLSALVKKALGADANTFNLQKLDGEKTTVEDIQTAVEALPFMAERKCVLVSGLDVPHMKKEQYEKLEELINQGHDGCVLVFYLSGIEINLKKQQEWKPFCALCEKQGVVVEFSLKDRGELAKALCERAKAAGCTLSNSCALRLVDICGRSVRVLYSELDKLCLYSDDGNITKEMIEQSAVPSVESSVYDMARAITGKNYGRAYSVLNELFYQKVKPELILNAISSAFIDLYRAAAAQANNKSTADIIKDFSYSPSTSFVVSNAVKAAGSVSIQSIKGCLLEIQEADLKLKTTGADKKIILEELIGRMIAADNTKSI